MLSLIRRLALLALVLSSCRCEEDVVTRICVSDAECAEGLFCDGGICRPGKRICVKGLFEEDCDRCSDHDQCPEGSRCPRSGLCIPPQCDVDTDCEQICSDDVNSLKVCVVQPDSGWRNCEEFSCGADQECADRFIDVPDGLTPVCVARGCRCRNPCGGDCPSGTVCCGEEANEDYGQCITEPEACSQAGCGLGFEAQQVDPGLWSISQCLTRDEICDCIELPALPLGDVGIHSDLAAVEGRAVIAAYNSLYGDLMLGVGDSQEMHWQFVDGVPAPTPANVTGGPSGPRSGISEKGPDVGRYPAVAIGRDETIHLVYQDVDQGRVVYARSLCGLGCDAGAICSAAGLCQLEEQGCEPSCLPGQACMEGQCLARAGRNRFHFLTLDDRGDGGYFNAIDLDVGQWPWIISAQHRVDLGRGLEARLVSYRAQDAAPRSVADFMTSEPAGQNEFLAQYPCEGGCPPQMVCGGANATCLVPTDDCDPACLDSELCRGGRCLERHFDPPRLEPVLANAHNQIVPIGVGLEAVWHDPVGDRVIRWVLGSAPQATALEGGDFVTMVAESGLRHLAFLRDESLVYAQLDDRGVVVHEELVDDGRRDRDGFSEQHVMAEPALDLAPDGTLTLYWQDASFQDVLIAQRSPGDESFGEAVTLLGAEDPYEGGYGFANRTARAEDTAWFSTFRFHLPDDPPDNGMVLLAR